MDLDNLIPFFVFAAFVLTSILKGLARKTKQGRADAPAPVKEKRKGLVGSLRDRLQALMEEAARQQKTRRGAQDNLPDDFYDDDLYDDDEAEPAPQPVRVTPRKTLVQPRHVAALDPKPDRCSSGLRTAGIALSRRRLRQAVIWSEIIGPPKALREVEDNSPLLKD